MGKIFYILGKSATGKDTIFKQLLLKKDMGLQVIVPYTTRPIRDGETQGVEYHFVDDKILRELETSGKIIELRAYDTVYGTWKYFTVDDGQIDLKENNYLMIGVLASYLKTKEYYGADKVVPLYIDLEGGVRLQRALDREKTQDEPKYEELCRRYLADSSDFSEDKIIAAGITKRFYNEDLETCLSEIQKYISEYKREQGEFAYERIRPE